MLFSNRRLCRHKHLYRTLNIPHSFASAWEIVDCVDLVYNEADGTLLIKPVRASSTTKTRVEATVDHSAADHFKVQ